MTSPIMNIIELGTGTVKIEPCKVSADDQRQALLFEPTDVQHRIGVLTGDPAGPYIPKESATLLVLGSLESASVLMHQLRACMELMGAPTPTIPAVEAAAREIGKYMHRNETFVFHPHVLKGVCAIITKHLAPIGHAQDEKTVREEADRTVEAKIPYHSQQEKARFVDVLLEFRAKHLAPGFQGGVERLVVSSELAELLVCALYESENVSIVGDGCRSESRDKDLLRGVLFSTLGIETPPWYAPVTPPPQNEAGTADGNCLVCGRGSSLCACLQPKIAPTPDLRSSFSSNPHDHGMVPTGEVKNGMAAFAHSDDNLRGTIERALCEQRWLSLDAVQQLTDRLCTALAGFGASADTVRLTFLLDYITAKGVNGLGELVWSVYDDEGKSLFECKSVSEDDVAEIRFDRAAIDRARTARQSQEEGAK